MEDLIETSAGAVLGGIATLLRHPARLRQVPGRPGDPARRRKHESLTATAVPSVRLDLRFIGHATVLLDFPGRGS